MSAQKDRFTMLAEKLNVQWYKSTSSTCGKGTAISGATGFTDVPKGEWYSDAVIWAVQKGITNGYGGGIFAPTETR